MDVSPLIDAGIAIIILTIIVKFILFPLSKKAIVTQLKMKKIEPELNAIKEKFKDNRQEQAVQTMALYRKHGVNPFSSIFLIFLQLPIIFALYKVFLSSDLHSINEALLYSFVAIPEYVNINFLNYFDISKKSLILALLAGISTFFQIKFSVPPIPKPTHADGAPKKPTFKDDLARSMNMQMRYVFPVLAFFISWSISGAIALYWITSNLFTLAQELVIRRSVRSKI